MSMASVFKKVCQGGYSCWTSWKVVFKGAYKKAWISNTDVEENDKDQAGDTDQCCYGVTVGKKNQEKWLLVTIQNATFNGFTQIASTSQKFQRENGFVVIAVNRKKNTHHNNYNFYSIETTESQQLHNAQQIVTTIFNTNVFLEDTHN